MTDRQRQAKIAKARRLALEAVALLDQVLTADRGQFTRTLAFDYDGPMLARAATDLTSAADRIAA